MILDTWIKGSINGIGRKLNLYMIRLNYEKHNECMAVLWVIVEFLITNPLIVALTKGGLFATGIGRSGNMASIPRTRRARSIIHSRSMIWWEIHYISVSGSYLRYFSLSLSFFRAQPRFLIYLHILLAFGTSTSFPSLLIKIVEINLDFFFFFYFRSFEKFRIFFVATMFLKSKKIRS